MARLIKSKHNVERYVTLSTVYSDHQVDRRFTANDIVENLRYVDNGEIKIVSGRINAIGYTVKDPISFDPKNPKDTLTDDMVLTNLVIDNSEQYKASNVVVPLREIVEFDGEEDTEPVVRMKYSPYVMVGMELYYSNYAVDRASIEIGDTFDNVRIMNPSDIGNDIKGKFKVTAFAYEKKGNDLNVIGLVMNNLEVGNTIIVPFDRILALNEVYDYDVTSPEAIAEILQNLADGDSLVFGTEIDTTGNTVILDKKDVTVELNDADVVADSSHTGGFKITGGSTTFVGNGVVVSKTPYDATHSTGVVRVTNDAEVTFNGSGVNAVMDDPVNKGQFGVCVYDAAKLTVNEGNFETGWYCVSGNGSTTGADAVTTINGGTLTSVADYAIYHPHPGKLVVNGGTIVGSAGAIAANAGVIEITGGKLISTGGGDTGDASDGTGGLGNAVLNLNARYGDIKCIISGGTFITKGEDTILVAIGSAHAVDLKIIGGKFSSKPNAEWIPEGYAVTNEADAEGLYEVYKVLL